MQACAHTPPASALPASARAMLARARAMPVRGHCQPCAMSDITSRVAQMRPQLDVAPVKAKVEAALKVFDSLLAKLA